VIPVVTDKKLKLPFGFTALKGVDVTKIIKRRSNHSSLIGNTQY